MCSATINNIFACIKASNDLLCGARRCTVFVRIKKAGSNSYLQIVENQREGKAVHQRVIATIGKADELIESGKLDAITRSFLKYTKAVQVVDAHRDGSNISQDSLRHLEGDNYAIFKRFQGISGKKSH